MGKTTWGSLGFKLGPAKKHHHQLADRENTNKLPALLAKTIDKTLELGRWMLALTAIGVTSFLVWWLSSVKDLRLATAIGLIIGGAVGNVIDRMVYGAVADFFLLHAFGYNWYVFNIADIAVVGGVILMALDLVLNETKGKISDAKEDRS